MSYLGCLLHPVLPVALRDPEWVAVTLLHPVLPFFNVLHTSVQSLPTQSPNKAESQ